MRDAAAVSRTLEHELSVLAARLRVITVTVRAGRASRGSGIVWSSDGAIVTNAHVASRAFAEIVLADGRRFTARVERRDVRRDLALLRVDAGVLAAAVARDPETVAPGELLIAIGHPLGVPNAVSIGIAHARVPRDGTRYLQAEVRLAPGNSGGPLADVRGRIVGINSMVVGSLALAVPSDDVNRFVGAGGGHDARAA